MSPTFSTAPVYDASIQKLPTASSLYVLSKEISTKQEETIKHVCKRSLSDIHVLQPKKPNIHSELLHAEDFTIPDLEDIASNFREDFGYKAGEAWGEYKVCKEPDCNTVLSIQDVFGLDAKQYVPLSLLESGRDKICCPKHPDTEMEDFWKKDELIESFKNKYAFNSNTLAYVLRNEQQRIVGTTIAYPSTFDVAWENEFEELHGQMKIPYAKALEELCHIDLHKHPEVYVWNLIAVTKPYRNPEYTQKLLEELGNAIPPKYYDRPILCEIDMNNPFTCLLLTFGTRVLCDSPLNDRLKIGVLAPRVIDFITGIRKYYGGDPELQQRAALYRTLQKEGTLYEYIKSEHAQYSPLLSFAV